MANLIVPNMIIILLVSDKLGLNKTVAHNAASMFLTLIADDGVYLYAFGYKVEVSDHIIC
jgi:hypothetical protein